ncbi:MAG: hypothetical protein IPI83_11130 [Sphingomonadales bacterium]|nr:hypothetical protein [Sphingomonadales bacterium]
MLLVRKYIRAAIVVAAVAVLASCGGGSAAGGGGGGSSSSSSGGSNPPGNVTSRISIDGTRAGQTLSGWEVTARFWELDKANDRYDGSWLASRDAIVQKLIDDAGITRVRLEVRSGVENPVDYWSQFVAGQIGYNAVAAIITRRSTTIPILQLQTRPSFNGPLSTTTSRISWLP